MYGSAFISFAILIVALGNGNVDATMSPEEGMALTESLYPFLSKCEEEFGYSQEKIGILSFADLSNDDCFASCFFKKSGLFTDDAKFDANKSSQMFEQLVKDKDELSKLNKIVEECARANDVKVSDGEKGCERAKLVAACFTEHKAEVLPE